jgi:hypothetical protein
MRQFGLKQTVDKSTKSCRENHNDNGKKPCSQKGKHWAWDKPLKWPIHNQKLSPKQIAFPAFFFVGDAYWSIVQKGFEF